MSKTFMEAVLQCEKESTQAGKLEAIKGIKKHHQRLIHEALNKHRRFNVRDWPEPVKYASKDYPVFTDFYKLLDDLASRRLTGNDARNSVTRQLGKFTKQTADVLRRVIRKDLDCGAEKTTWLKMYPELDLPNFKVMLAKKMPDDPKDFRWSFPCLADTKYDGHRLVAISNEGEVSYFSRSGRQADFCNGLFDNELKAIENALGHPVVIDGEVLGNGFQDTAQSKGEKNKEHKKRLRLYAFDMMPLSDWVVRSCSTPQAQRTYDLSMVLAEVQAQKIIMVDSRVINSVQEATDFYEKVVKQGQPGMDEGLIIKDPEGLYEWDRSSSWVKWKPVYPVDLKVYSVTPGNGKYKGIMGALECGGKDENGDKIEASVGGGFSDKERLWFWNNRARVPGLVIEAEYSKKTKAKNSDTWSLRYPQFVQIRWDKSKVKPF